MFLKTPGEQGSRCRTSRLSLPPRKVTACVLRTFAFAFVSRIRGGVTARRSRIAQRKRYSDRRGSTVVARRNEGGTIPPWLGHGLEIAHLEWRAFSIRFANMPGPVSPLTCSRPQLLFPSLLSHIAIDPYVQPARRKQSLRQGSVLATFKGHRIRTRALQEDLASEAERFVRDIESQDSSPAGDLEAQYEQLRSQVVILQLQSSASAERCPAQDAWHAPHLEEGTINFTGFARSSAVQMASLLQIMLNVLSCQTAILPLRPAARHRKRLALAAWLK